MRNDESKVNPADNELGYRNNSASKKMIFSILIVICLLLCTGFKIVLFSKNYISLGFAKTEIHCTIKPRLSALGL